MRIALVGAGKFGAMFLSQCRRTPGLHVAGIADLDRNRAAASLARVGWPADRYAAHSLDEALARGTTWLTEDSAALLDHGAVEIVIEATGNPLAGCDHALRAIDAGKHVVMVNVEADALAGPALARRAAAAGVAYSLAYGDQPALICELVDWARTAGLEVVCAGKGTKYLPAYHAATPDTVWGHYGFSDDMVADGELNPRMFNSFLDGTKSAIEMAAVANATGLVPQDEGLGFPPCGVDDLPRVCRPREDGGHLQRRGTVEVVSSLETDGRPVRRDLRWGVYVTFDGGTEYVRRCFREYGVVADPDGRYAALYRPYHFIGLELGISVASVGLLGEPTGCAKEFAGDAVAVAKRDMSEGEPLDGEGGYCVHGRLVPAGVSVAGGLLPIGLSSGVRLRRAVRTGETLRLSDVNIDHGAPAVALRKELSGADGDSVRTGLG